jgi:hypothetical protein
VTVAACTFSKSADTVYTEAQFVAKKITALAGGKTIAWQSPQTLCNSIVGINILLGISTQTRYKFVQSESHFEFHESQSNELRDKKKGDEVSV